MNIELKVERFDAGDGEREYVTLRAYEDLLGEMGALRRDVIDLRSNQGALLKSEVDEIATVRAQHRNMMDEQNDIALFLREHYKDDIALGQHNGMTLVQVVTKYLGRERLYARDQIVNSRTMFTEPAKVAKVKKRAAR